MERAFLESLALAPEVIDAVMAEHDQTVQQWQDKYTQAVTEAENARFDGLLDKAITAAGGRNAKAITALLDLQALRAADDPAAAAAEAVTKLKQQNDYLFMPAVQAPYAPGTGTGAFTAPAPQTLAAALKEKFQR